MTGWASLGHNPCNDIYKFCYAYAVRPQISPERQYGLPAAFHAYFYFLSSEWILAGTSSKSTDSTNGRTPNSFSTLSTKPTNSVSKSYTLIQRTRRSGAVSVGTRAMGTHGTDFFGCKQCGATANADAARNVGWRFVRCRRHGSRWTGDS